MRANPSEAFPLAADDRALIKDYWLAYDPLRAKLQPIVQDLAKQIPDFARMLAQMTPQQQAEQEKLSREMERRAILEGDWNAFAQNMRQQGVGYAEQGIAFSAWFRLLTGFRTVLAAQLVGLNRENPAAFDRVIKGMNLFIDYCMAHIGEAYLDAKEGIIGKQALAIQELSTPVLQVRDQLLIIPLVGMVDTHRARQLTESMLKAVRERRARAAVIDITGVPIVDSKVANHLVQACEAARLMGAKVILTGISSEIAQALVTIGAELRGVPTVGDLQGGIEEAERLLGYRVVAETLAS